MDSIVLSTMDAKCTVQRHGAHITSYQRNGDERLFLSQKAVMDGTKPIRGGIPICWPWFGQLHPDIAKHGIAHGLVRNQLWRVTARVTSDTFDSVTLQPYDTSHSLWPNGLTCQLKITLSDHLAVELITQNVGNTVSEFTGALHTYFAVDDITKVHLTGFGAPHQYLNQLDGQHYPTPTDAYIFYCETDRVHMSALSETTIHSNFGGNSEKQTQIAHAGHDSLVVWNPWIDKAANMSDLDNAEYQKFVCIETAVTQGVTLQPNDTHILKQMIY